MECLNHSLPLRYVQPSALSALDDMELDDIISPELREAVRRSLAMNDALTEVWRWYPLSARFLRSCLTIPFMFCSHKLHFERIHMCIRTMAVAHF
eukprot:1146279-Pelagomonas_calceolata.AAC.14